LRQLRFGVCGGRGKVETRNWRRQTRNQKLEIGKAKRGRGKPRPYKTKSRFLATLGMTAKAEARKKPQGLPTKGAGTQKGRMNEAGKGIVFAQVVGWGLEMEKISVTGRPF
jgi:hypothetical protein